QVHRCVPFQREVDEHLVARLRECRRNVDFTGLVPDGRAGRTLLVRDRERVELVLRAEEPGVADAEGFVVEVGSRATGPARAVAGPTRAARAAGAVPSRAARSARAGRAATRSSAVRAARAALFGARAARGCSAAAAATE